MFRELAAEITGDASDYVSATELAKASASRFGDEAVSLSARLSVLQGRADEAADEMGELGRSSTTASGGLISSAFAATSTSGAFSSLALTTEGLSVSFGSLTTSITGTIGVLGAAGALATGLASTLAPLAAVVGSVTAGLGALAGSFGLVLGSGVVAFTQRVKTLEETLTDLRGALTPIITEFGEQFIPLIRDGLAVIPALVRDTLDAVGGMEVFADTLRELGGIARDAIPAIAGTFADLAREALPMLMESVSWLQANAASAFSGMLDVARELGPTLIRLGDAFVDALPEITALGTFILKRGIPALTGFLGVLEDVLGAAQGGGGIAGFFRRLAPSIKSGLQAAVDAVGNLWSTFKPVFVDLATGAVQWLQGPGRALLQRVVGVAFDAIEAEAGERLSGLGARLGTMLSGSFSGMIRSLQRTLGSKRTQSLVRESFEAFGSVLRQTVLGIGHALANTDWVSLAINGWKVMLRTGVSALEGFVEGLLADESFFETFVDPVVRHFRTGINEMIRHLNALIREANTTLPAVQMGTLDTIDVGSQRPQRPAGSFTGGLNSRAEAGPREQNITVRVEGDTEVVKDVAVETYNQQSRQAVDDIERGAYRGG